MVKKHKMSHQEKAWLPLSDIIAMWDFDLNLDPWEKLPTDKGTKQEDIPG